MEKINVNCELSADEVQFLDKLAEAKESDRDGLIGKVVADYIALQRWQVEEIDKAITEADAGQFATDAEVRAAFVELRS